MARLIRNAAECRHCREVIVSKHRHDFVVHYCAIKQVKDRKWEDGVLVETDDYTWLFAVDGGLAYAKRCGDFSSMIDRCEYEDDTPENK